jgi:hypothetical protein
MMQALVMLSGIRLGKPYENKTELHVEEGELPGNETTEQL